MDVLVPSTLWLIAGLVLVATELVLPGLITVFMGLAALCVAGLLYLGLLEGLGFSLAAWLAFTGFFMAAVRPRILRLFPADVSIEPHEPDLLALGAEVDVLESIDSDSTVGRVRFQGTSWQAQSTKGRIPAGGKARLVVRDNLVWMVEPLEEGSTVPLLSSAEADKNKLR